MRRAFTVIELLVAVVVLLAVIIATSKVFNTASKVASLGEANADVLQQGTVLEEQLRRDLQRICRDGFMAIQCVEVPNNVNKAAGGTLLNPQLPETAPVRCDQLVFFTAGSETSARWAGPGDLVAGGGGQQARAAMVRYGHAVQFPALTNDALVPANQATPTQPGSPVRPIITGAQVGAGTQREPVVPWFWRPGNPQVCWNYALSSQANSSVRVPANQPEARQWVLARKAVLLADDGHRSIFYPEPEDFALARSQGASAAPSIFGDRANTAGEAPNVDDRFSHYQESRDRAFIPRSTSLIPSPLIQSGWVDVAGSDLDRVRRVIAPTLRLASPLTLPPGVQVRSVSVPWGLTASASLALEASLPAFPTGTPSPGSPPLGWPTDPDAFEDWPSNSGVVVVGRNMAVNSPTLNPGPPTVRDFTTQRDRIMRGVFGVPASGSFSTVQPLVGLLGWPRSEKAVPNNDRKSEMLMSPTLVTNCSSFRVDWTWESGTGRQVDSAGRVIGTQPRELFDRSLVPIPVLTGLGYPQGSAEHLWVLSGFSPFVNPAAAWPDAEAEPPSLAVAQPWFGLPDPATGVGLAQTFARNARLSRSQTAFVPYEQSNKHMARVAVGIEGGQQVGAPPLQLAESSPLTGHPSARFYTAVFGFNQDEAFVVTPDGFLVLRDDFTPWPTQLRITATIHDPRLVLDRGREFQFVIDVPKRSRD